MKNSSSSLAYHSPLGEKLLGQRDQFSMENRLFSLVCLVAALASLVFIIINIVAGNFLINILIGATLIVEGGFYYLSRFKKIYQKSIVINGAFSYVALVLNYYFNAGINGPTIFLCFFTFNLLIVGTPARLHRWWLILHTFIIIAVVTSSYIWPTLVKNNYTNNLERFVDILSCYLVTLIFIFIVTRFLLGYYIWEKQKTESSQITLSAFFETSESLYILINRNFKITYFNHAASRFIKQIHDRKVREGDSIDKIINPGYVDDFKMRSTDSLNGIKFQEEKLLEYDVLGKIWWQFTFAPVYRQKSVVGVSFIAENINRQKEHEEKIKEKNMSLLRIAFIQSHELRQPVSSILGLINLANDDRANREEYYYFLNEAVAELQQRFHEITGRINNISAGK